MISIETRIEQNLRRVREAIDEAAIGAGRQPRDVSLIAVTKKNPPKWIRPLVGLGVAELGENYPQELWGKVEALSGLPVRWHLIGHLQSNKLRRTLPMVTMVHAVDSARLLGAIDHWATESGSASVPSVCLQVNASGEASKHGWSIDDEAGLAEAIRSTRSVAIDGLMTIAGYGTDDESARPAFAGLRALRDRLVEATGRPLPALSMGMSGDFRAAIAEGATHLRIGSALFEGLPG